MIYRGISAEREGTMRSYTKISTCAALVGALVLGGTVAANAHGYVGNEKSDVTARAAMPGNVNLGPIQYEPQSIEGPKGFSLDPSTGGPADGKLASGGNHLAVNLDEQSPGRWVENEVTAGSTIAIGWKYTAQHMTSKWHYYITKTGWDQNSPLNRAELQPLATVEHDGSLSPQGTAHHVKLPADLRGDHVILAVWDVADTANAFYNAIDVNLSGGAVDPDTTAPTVPADLRATSTTAKSVDLTWTASSDDVGVDHYEIHRADKGGEFTTLGISTTVRYQDATVAAGKDYEYRVIALDAAGNRSEASEILSVTTPKEDEGPDAIAPTAPTGVHSMKTTENSVDLMWNPATDNVGVDHYEIHRAVKGAEFQKVAKTAKTRRIDEGLQPGITYQYQVVAVDAAGNASAPSDTFTVTTKGAPAIKAWDPKGTYKKGDRVMHKGKVYEAVQDHKGNGDPSWINAPSLWKLVG